MSIAVFLSSLLAVLLLADTAAAQAPSPVTSDAATPELVSIGTEWATRNPPQTLTLRSALLGEERRVYVQLPHDYQRSGQRYPVLVVLDGEWLFELARAHVRFYSEYEAMSVKLPQMIVVGIENIDRDRDYTPTPNSGVEYTFDSAGHADRFLDFLELELLPFLDGRYRTAPSRTLAGWSFGGLFTVHTAIFRPQLFDAYLAIGPAVWWDEDLMLRRLREMKPERAKRMVLTLGSEEAGGWVHDSSTRILEALAEKPIPNLSLEHIEFAGVGHSWGIPAAFDKGLQRLFDGYVAPDGVRSEGLAAIDAYYAELSAQWHYPVQAPYTVLQSLVLSGWKDTGDEEALALLREVVRRYPVEPGAHYFLGRRLKKAGRAREGLAAVERALELERSRQQPRMLKLLQFESVVEKERASMAAAPGAD